MTIDDDLNQAPADTETGNTIATPDVGTTAATDKAPAATPAAGAGAADGDLDLLDADEVEEGADASEPRAAEATDADADGDRPAWQRPDGLEGDDLIEWKRQQGLPVDEFGYQIELELREGQSITETGQQLIDGLKEFAVENDLPPPAVSKLAQWYDAQVKAQHAKLAETDKLQRTETRNTLTQKWAGAYDHRMQVAKEGARLLPPSLRQALQVARTPDGKRVADLPELAEAMLAIGRLTQKGKPMPTSDEARLAEVNQIMRTDIDRYEREGLSKEALDIGRKIAAKAQPAPVALSPAEAEEERVLVQLMSDDIDQYRHRQFRGSGKTGSERLLEIRRKRDGAAA